jgi:hypothetical protein
LFCLKNVTVQNRYVRRCSSQPSSIWSANQEHPQHHIADIDTQAHFIYFYSFFVYTLFYFVVVNLKFHKTRHLVSNCTTCLIFSLRSSNIFPRGADKGFTKIVLKLLGKSRTLPTILSSHLTKHKKNIF